MYWQPCDGRSGVGSIFQQAEDPRLLVIPKALMQRLEYSVCYAH